MSQETVASSRVSVASNQVGLLMSFLPKKPNFRLSCRRLAGGRNLGTDFLSDADCPSAGSTDSLTLCSEFSASKCKLVSFPLAFLSSLLCKILLRVLSERLDCNLLSTLCTLCSPNLNPTLASAAPSSSSSPSPEACALASRHGVPASSLFTVRPQTIHLEIGEGVRRLSGTHN